MEYMKNLLVDYQEYQAREIYMIENFDVFMVTGCIKASCSVNDPLAETLGICRV